MFHAMVFVTIKVYTLYTGSTLTPNSPLLIIQHAFHVSASKTTLIGWVNRPTMHQENPSATYEPAPQFGLSHDTQLLVLWPRNSS